jgi:hypothetical protein
LPKWWLLYLTFPFSVALLAVDSRLKISTGGHQMVEIGIILLVCGLAHLWLKANARALSAMDRAQFSGRVAVPRLQPHPLHAQGNEYKKRQMFRLPDSEIKGTLSQTFEMDHTDAEFVSLLDEVHKN